MPTTWQAELDAEIDKRFDDIVALRRHLHSNPEVSGEERQTSLYLYQLFGNQGFDVRMGPDGCGVVADIQPFAAEGDGARLGAQEQRASEQGTSDLGIIALRADIDALRIHDMKQVPYRSQHPGVMHACGHDAHTALVFGALAALRQVQLDGKLPWAVRGRGIFQPAEETCEGACRMIEVGCLEGVKAVIAAHVNPSRQVGHIGIRAGLLTANCDEMQIRIVGRGGHAARPHEASDPIAAAAQLINSLYLFIPRATDSQDAVVVTIGQVLGGDNANVIPEEVVLRGTVRTLDRGVRQQTFDHIRRLAAGIGQTTDTRIEVHYGLASQSVRNDGNLVSLLERAGREVLGDRGVEEIPRPSMGSEDFAFYLDHVPGAMMRLGCASSSSGGPPLHSPNFDVNEEALRFGAKILARTAVFWSDPQLRPPAPQEAQTMDSA